MRYLLFIFFFWAVFLFYSHGSLPQWQQLAPPDTVGMWIQPHQEQPAMPVWGHKNGISIGLSPLPGPRGLIRIYTPYLELSFPEVMNFIAFEPIPKKSEQRGLSELEMSSMDLGKRGKRFWSSNDPLAFVPTDVEFPASGIIEKTDGEEILTLYIFSESFDNGAKVYVRIRFFESRPYEFEITTYKYGDSAELDYFITTATMGNKARLRTLFLKDKQLSSLDLWPDYKEYHFTPHVYFEQNELPEDPDGNSYFIASPDEEDFSQTVFAPKTHSNWKYKGKKATQYWIFNNSNRNSKGVVNGRFAYWGSKIAIPGGISFENFEIISPFESGTSYIFGISPYSPENLIKNRIKAD